MNKIVYKIEQDNSNILLNLKINEYFPIQDNSNNKLIINKLLLENSKLYLETGYLKILDIDYDNSKLYVELPKSHIDFFNNLDELCQHLLEHLLNGNTELNIAELVESLNINSDDDDLNIQYKSLLNDDSNILKVNIFSNTTIKHNDNNLDIEKIKSGDLVGLVLGLDYVSLLVDTDSLIARTKLYCYFIQIHKQHIYNPEPRETIKNWDFSSKLGSENIFLKTDITEIDNVDVKTELAPNNLKLNKISHENLTNELGQISGNKSGENNDSNNINQKNISLPFESLKLYESNLNESNLNESNLNESNFCDNNSTSSLSSNNNLKLLSAIIDNKHIEKKQPNTKNSQNKKQLKIQKNNKILIEQENLTTKSELEKENKKSVIKSVRKPRDKKILTQTKNSEKSNDNSQNKILIDNPNQNQNQNQNPSEIKINKKGKKNTA